MFVADFDASHIQVAVLAHGNGIRINHCVFKGVKNAVVYWMSDKKADKMGNGMTNSIIIDSKHAIWTAWKDKDFIFKNNIVANCKYFWIRNQNNSTLYPVEKCMVVNNTHYQGVPTKNSVEPTTFDMNENNVTKEGEVSIRLINNIDDPIPNDYLNIVPGTQGYELNAGIFIKERK